jgi:hypothetical protein
LAEVNATSDATLRAAAAAEPNSATGKRPTLLYILSPSYSGSTLMTYLLAQHPRIATIGELKATGMGDVGKYRCSCGELIAACAFWKRVADECGKRGIEFSVERFGTSLRSPNRVTDLLLRTRVRGAAFEGVRATLLRALPSTRAEAAELLRRNFELSQIICTLQGRDIFLDGSKDAPRLLHFVRSGLWTVRALFLTRDGRGVANSFRTRRKIDVATSTSQWLGTIQEDLNAVRLLRPDEVLTVKYERLCQDPAATLGAIWQWLGIENPPYGQDFRGGESHILGNEMRLSRKTEITLDERWRRDLGPDALREFDSRAGRLNRSLGYE